MKKRGAKFVMISSALMIIFVFLYFKLKYPDQNTLLATVNDEKITLWHIKEYSKTNYGYFNENKIPEIVDLLINQKILMIHAEKTGIIKNVLQPQFEKQEKYSKDKLMLELFFEIHSKETINISNDDLKTYYENQPLFTLKAISFPYSDPQSEKKAFYAYQELIKRQDFNEIYNIFFSDSKYIKPGIIGISNFYNLPDYLKEYSKMLEKTGNATKPIESEFGFTVFYRDLKPSYLESRKYIENELFKQKAIELQITTYENIKNNNKLNLFSINKIYNEKKIKFLDNILASNHITNDFLKENELSELLSDLYNIDKIDELSLKDLHEYVSLLLSQKVILSLARKYSYYDNHQFLSKWNREKANIQEMHSQEIINYMMTRFYEENLNILAEKELLNEFNNNANQYRKSDLFKLQTVITNNRETANLAYNEAIKNINFNNIVKKYSNDPYANISNGITPYLTKDDLKTEFEYLVDRNIGDIIAPIEIEVGLFHIYKIIDRVPGAKKSFDEVKTQITSQVLLDKMNDYIKNIQKIHKIKINKFY
ncbi:MAG: peptidyl-prolyl cis-trans isomerase [Candidatus Cloacimonetes bacterium]|nr:peptidyl-prolyl cis-trans isomerase [Candidatus Cloacimonadota bacterium]